MAYYLKYYAEIYSKRQLTRVEILQRSDSAFSVLEIGDVSGLVLEIQGGQDDVFTPIVKTQARLSMVSCDDKPNADGIKYGNWQEFYTPDATLYKMCIKTKPLTSAASWTTRWTGYVTPDSWQEGLEYRGTVTITARDNIGHLQDFEFDAHGDSYGLISIRSLISAAMSKIQLPMTFVTNQSAAIVDDQGTEVLDAMVNVSLFSGRDWYSVLEDVLDSVGYTIRFTDDNRVTLAAIRYLPLLGEASEQAQPAMADLNFYGGNAEMVPAVKQITDAHSYDYQGTVSIPIVDRDGMTFGNNETYRCSWTGEDPFMGVRVNKEEHDAPYHVLQSAGNTAWEAGSKMLNIKTPRTDNEGDTWEGGSVQYNEGDGWDNYAVIPANAKSTTPISASLRFYCGTADVTIKASFSAIPLRVDYGTGIKSIKQNSGRLVSIEYHLKYVDGNTEKHWSGSSWGDTAIAIKKEYDDEGGAVADLEIPLTACEDIQNGGFFVLTFDDIVYEGTSSVDALSSWIRGMYARLASVEVTLNRENLSKNTVRTINDEKYNVMMSRKPVISPLSRITTIARPENYVSAMFRYIDGRPSSYPYLVNWDGISDVVKPLPVLIHQQVLCYRGASLWELSGDCAPQESGMFRLNAVCHYKGRNYILMSGTLDFTTGHMTSAILREYLEYDDIWDDTEQGDWTDVTEYPNGESTPQSSGGGKPSGGRSGGINYFEEDGNGGIKLKDEYSGLWAAGFLSAGGRNPGGGGGGGVDMLRVWQDLTNDSTLSAYDSTTKIHIDHIPLLGIWRSLADNSLLPYYDANTKIALSHIPDITTAKVSNLGTWAGSANITTLGTIATGEWNATPIPVSKGGTGRTRFDDAAGAVLVASSYNVIGHVTNNSTSTRKYLSQVNGGVPTWESISVSTPKATNSTIGGFKTGYTPTGKNYAVQLDSNDKAFVNVPWSDDNTIYKLTVNGTEKGTSGGTDLGRIYAPTTSGTSGYVLASSGNGAPSWINNPTFAALRLKQPSSNYGSELYFGDGANAYIKEGTDDHLLFHAANGITIDSATVIGSTTTNKNLTVHGSLYIGASAYWNIDTYSRMHTNADVKVDGEMIVGGTASNKDLTVFGKLRLGKTSSPAASFIEYDTTYAALHTNAGLYSNSFLTAGVVASSSDERLKANLKDIALTVEQIADARAVEFDWLKPHLGRGCGSIAQYWEKVLPLCVSECGGIKTMQYGNIALISAIILARKVRELEAEIVKLRRAAV